MHPWITQKPDDDVPLTMSEMFTSMNRLENLKQVRIDKTAIPSAVSDQAPSHSYLRNRASESCFSLWSWRIRSLWKYPLHTRKRYSRLLPPSDLWSSMPIPLVKSLLEAEEAPSDEEEHWFRVEQYLWRHEKSWEVSLIWRRRRLWWSNWSAAQTKSQSSC